MTRMGLAAAAALLVACSRPPERVYVPGPSFGHAVEARTDQGLEATVRVGEWLTLHARRATGPWVVVDRKSLAPDACWSARAPLEEEPEVADQVRWTPEPAGLAVFNLGILADHTRRVRFTRAGRYVLRATSKTCRDSEESNEITVLVRD